jgi:NAD/NADP transhydrogenase beta subunit
VNRITPLILAVALFMEMMDGTVIATSLPAIAADIGAEPIALDEARTVVVVKRSLSPGFACIPNPLFAMDNTLMLFVDAKKVATDLVAAVKEL